MQFEHINTHIPEGKLLLAAISLLTKENDTLGNVMAKISIMAENIHGLGKPMKKAEVLEQCNVANQYLGYLNRINIKEADMHPAQKLQVKQAFYGGTAAMLVLFTTVLAEIPEDQGAAQLDGLLYQVENYWRQYAGPNDEINP